MQKKVIRSLKKPSITWKENGEYIIDSLSIDHITTWVKTNRMPKKFLDIYLAAAKSAGKSMEFFKAHPHPAQEQLNDFAKSMINPIEEGKNWVTFQDFLVENFATLVEALDASQQGGLFTTAFNLEESFGIPREVTDWTTYLKKMISNKL